MQQTSQSTKKKVVICWYNVWTVGRVRHHFQLVKFVFGHIGSVCVLRHCYTVGMHIFNWLMPVGGLSKYHILTAVVAHKGYYLQSDHLGQTQCTTSSSKFHQTHLTFYSNCLCLTIGSVTWLKESHWFLLLRLWKYLFFISSYNWSQKWVSWGFTSTFSNVHTSQPNLFTSFEDMVVSFDEDLKRTKFCQQCTSACAWLLFQHFKQSLILHNKVLLTLVFFKAGLIFLEMSELVLCHTVVNSS